MSRLSGKTASATWNPASVTTTVVATTVTVPGAKLGDFAFASLSALTDALADDLIISACVSSANTVTVSLLGDATGADLASGTVRVLVVPYESFVDVI
jgi:hypothetical protein